MGESTEFSPDPVQRLRLLLEAALETGEIPHWQVWCEVLDVEAQNPDDFLPIYQEVRQLYTSAVKRMSELDELDVELYLEWVKPIGTILQFNYIGTNWKHVKEKLQPTVMQALRFSAHESLRHPQKEVTVSPDLLSEIRQSVERLQSELIESNVATELKELLSVQLEAIRQALIAYRLRGAAALQTALERATGACVLHWEMIESSKSGEVNIFKSIIVKLQAVLDGAWKIKVLAGSLSKLLDSGNGP